MVSRKFPQRLVFFAVTLIVLLSSVAGAQANPFILGSAPDKAAAQALGLQGTFVATTAEVPDGASVLFLGKVFTGAEEFEGFVLLDRGCRIIRLDGPGAEEFTDMVKSYQTYVGSGQDPFAEVPPGMGTIKSERPFPVLSKTAFSLPERRHRDPDHAPKGLFHPPPPPDPPESSRVPPGFGAFTASGRQVLDVNFDLESAVITAASFPALERLFLLLQRNPRFRLTIEGHTDIGGNTTGESNQSLSERRARAVKEWLVGKGIPAGRLTTAGFGSSRPISGDRARNRRVEIVKD